MDSPLSANAVQSKAQLIEVLQRRIARLEGAKEQLSEFHLSSGWPLLDQALPKRGFVRGALVEWLAEGEGSGAVTLALATAREACHGGGLFVVIDARGEFYPPAAVRNGVEPANLVVVHPRRVADQIWALDQSLRCRGVSAVLAWPERLDDRTFRRLQLAAEEGGAVGLLVRPWSARQEPSWAEVRLGVSPLPSPGPLAGRRLRLEVFRVQGGRAGAVIELEVEHATDPLPLVARLARPASRRAAGA